MIRKKNPTNPNRIIWEKIIRRAKNIHKLEDVSKSEALNRALGEELRYMK